MRITNKKIYINLFLLVIINLIFPLSCQKASINGHLDGRWQLMDVENADGIKNVKEDQLYYNFYMHVCNISTYGEITAEANLSYENNLITLYFPYIKNENGMSKLADYYIFSNPVEFQVEHISKNKMILKEGDLIITLRKF